MNDGPPGETLATRNQISKAREQILADESLSDQEKVLRMIEMLERAKIEAGNERARDAAPRFWMDKANAILNSMCAPPDIPIEEEIDRVIAHLRGLLSEQ